MMNLGIRLIMAFLNQFGSELLISPQYCPARVKFDAPLAIDGLISSYLT